MTGESRILIVDDEEVVRDVLQRILTGAGYDVITAANGEEAIYKLNDEEIKLVLLDIKMPGMTGIEILGKLTAEWPDIGAIMITAVIDTQTAVKALKMGALDYITKPFDRDDVTQKVREAIGKWNQLVKGKEQYLELKEKFREHTKLMQDQFSELVNSLAREHKLLFELATKQAKGSKALLSGLPPELQKQISSAEEFRDVMLQILRKK
jgi:DNA-binding NtrC family response regulator